MDNKDNLITEKKVKWSDEQEKEQEELGKQKSTPIIINFDLRGFTTSEGDINNYVPNYK